MYVARKAANLLKCAVEVGVNGALTETPADPAITAAKAEYARIKAIE